VHLAPPARQKHIAHYICLDKAEPEFGGDVLQNDNADGDGTLPRPLLGPAARALSGNALVLCRVRCVQNALCSVNVVPINSM